MFEAASIARSFMPISSCFSEQEFG